MRTLFLLGLVGLSGYLLYDNYTLRKQISAGAIPPAATGTATAIPAPGVATANMVTSQQAEIVPNAMLESYDAEHFSKFPWK